MPPKPKIQKDSSKFMDSSISKPLDTSRATHTQQRYSSAAASPTSAIVPNFDFDEAIDLIEPPSDIQEPILLYIKSCLGAVLSPLLNLLALKDAKITQLESQLKDQNLDQSSILLKLDHLEQQTKRNNLKISGIPIEDSRPTSTIVVDIAKQAGLSINLSDIEQSYYIGKLGNSVHHDRFTIDNGLRFSPCSERTILNLMKQNEREGINCLGNKVDTHAHGVGTYMTYYPGQEYDLFQQCIIAFGDSSKPCVQKSDFEEICVILYCTEPGSKDCKTPGDFTAAMGTPCGQHKWCMEGRCVYDPKAKSYDIDAEIGNMVLV